MQDDVHDSWHVDDRFADERLLVCKSVGVFGEECVAAITSLLVNLRCSCVEFGAERSAIDRVEQSPAQFVVRFGVTAIENAVAFPAFGHQSGLMQYLEVMAERRLRRRKYVAQLQYAERILFQRPEDIGAQVVSDRLCGAYQVVHVVAR